MSLPDGKTGQSLRKSLLNELGCLQAKAKADGYRDSVGRYTLGLFDTAR